MKFIRLFLGNFDENLSENSLNQIESLFVVKQLKKGDIIVNIDDSPEDFYIIKSGIIRSYIVDETGKQHIKNLYSKLHVTGALSAMIKQTKSKTTYDCLTDCEVYIGNLKDFWELTRKNHELALFNNRVLERIFLSIEDRIRSLTILDATQRYYKALNDFPNIENLIPQYHIAAYLNITNVQLSRIRRKILQNNQLFNIG